MRIVGGTWRGRPILSPEGRGTRPTTDRTREAVASMVLSAAGLDLSGVAVLDAFAGSGAMGLELLSRGAERCTFVERDRRAAAVVRKNVAALGAAPVARVAVGDVLSLAAAGRLDGPFGVVFLDPPYALGAQEVSGLVASLARAGQLAEGAIVVYEHAVGTDGLGVPGLALSKSKGRGSTVCDLMTYAGGAQMGAVPNGTEQAQPSITARGTSPSSQDAPQNRSLTQERTAHSAFEAGFAEGD